MKDKQPTDKQRIEFAKQLEYMYEISQPGWPKIILFAFVKGMAMATKRTWARAALG
jgi:hypothetical protein